MYRYDLPPPPANDPDAARPPTPAQLIAAIPPGASLDIQRPHLAAGVNTVGTAAGRLNRVANGPRYVWRRIDAETVRVWRTK